MCSMYKVHMNQMVLDWLWSSHPLPWNLWRLPVDKEASSSKNSTMDRLDLLKRHSVRVVVRRLPGCKLYRNLQKMQVQTCQMCHAWLLSTPPISTALVSIWWSQCSDAKAEPNFRRFESGHASVPRFWTDFCLPNPLSRQSEKCGWRESAEEFHLDQSIPRAVPKEADIRLGNAGGGNGDSLFFFENNGGFDIAYTGHLDGKTANSTDFPSYRCIVLHIISCLSHSTL